MHYPNESDARRELVDHFGHQFDVLLAGGFALCVLLTQASQLRPSAMSRPVKETRATSAYFTVTLRPPGHHAHGGSGRAGCQLPIEDIAFQGFAAVQRHGDVAAVVECLFDAFGQLVRAGDVGALQRGPGSDGFNLDERCAAASRLRSV